MSAAASESSAVVLESSAAAAELEAEIERRCESFLRLLARWNRVHNLTAARDAPARARHLRDCLCARDEFPPQSRIIDIGSGNGFPAVPLAVARPDCRFDLVEARAKKASFLRQAAIELDLANVRVRETRIEDWSPAAPPDFVTARGFADLAASADAVAHFFRPPQTMLCWKAVDPRPECEELARRRPRFSISRRRLPPGGAMRWLVAARA